MMDRPKDVHIPIPEAWDYVTLQGKRDFAAVTKLKDLGMETYPGLSAEPKVIKGSL